MPCELRSRRQEVWLHESARKGPTTDHQCTIRTFIVSDVKQDCPIQLRHRSCLQDKDNLDCNNACRNQQSISSNVTMLANMNDWEVWLQQCFVWMHNEKIDHDDDCQSRPWLRVKQLKSSITMIHGNTQSSKIDHDENRPIKNYNQKKSIASDQDDQLRNDQADQSRRSMVTMIAKSEYRSRYRSRSRYHSRSRYRSRWLIKTMIRGERSMSSSVMMSAQTLGVLILPLREGQERRYNANTFCHIVAWLCNNMFE